jgi:hypothetical protein
VNESLRFESLNLTKSFAGSDVVLTKHRKIYKHRDYVGQASRRYQNTDRQPPFPAVAERPALPGVTNYTPINQISSPFSG